MSDLKIETWFPTVIGVIDYPEIKEIQKIYGKILKKLKFDRRGFSYHQLQSDKRFKKITEWVVNNVNDYSKIHNFNDYYDIGESWINDYRAGEPQPYHAHNGWTISANFIFKSDVRDMATIFKSPYYIDMKNPIKSSPKQISQLPLNEYTYKTTTYPPIEGRLLIFRSNIEHCTGLRPNHIKLKSKRITIHVYVYIV